MRKRFKVAAVGLAAMATLAGCASSTSMADSSGSPTVTSNSPASLPAATPITTDNWDTSTVLGTLMAANQKSHYQDSDAVIDEASVIDITLNDSSATVDGNGVNVNGSTVTITAGGSYRLSGSLNGQIVVTAEAEDVQIILNGVELTNSTGSPMVITAADEVTLVLADGTTNSISDASAYSDTTDGAPNSAIDSASDLSIAGSGSLSIKGNYNDAINSSDGLVIASGDVTIEATDDGLRGQDYVIVYGGIVNITSGGDGIKSDNESDADRGYVYISGGAITINVGDDGINAYNDIAIAGGSLTITRSYEGLEAQTIAIADGTVDVTSSDDGINISGTNATLVDIAGGTTRLDTGGDGLDSNGSANITGGTLIIFGPEHHNDGAADIDGEFTISGGTLWAIGSSGMAMTPTQNSTQAFVSATVNDIATGTLQIKDSSGNVIGEIGVGQQWTSAIFSSPEVSAEGTYEIVVEGTSVGTVSANQHQSGMGGGPGGGRR